MNGLWCDVALLLDKTRAWSQGENRDRAFSTEGKVELLARIVANLVDEIEILREFAKQKSGLSHAQWLEEYRKHKMWFLFSSAGAPSASILKYLRYLWDAEETAAKLIPDEAERTREIDSLICLT